MPHHYDYNGGLYDLKIWSLDIMIFMISIVTIIAVTFGYLMGGVVIVENVFSWNGIGRLALEAIILRDYPIIQGFVLIFASIIILISILIDISYAWLDPRITYK